MMERASEEGDGFTSASSGSQALKMRKRKINGLHPQGNTEQKTAPERRHQGAGELVRTAPEGQKR